ncbi:cytochrome P450 704C1-like [Andrographis paniculata]|uniref:cytochrome P450 704C1-like n=1 Tax=Andrographis paniculata TaxID=175694 RepID=UPI0021E8B338|nr:cytochrome P450 704C1-like [Andrographis paniculata]
MAMFIPTLFLTACVAVAFARAWIILRLSRSKKKRYHPVRGTVIHSLINFDRLHDFISDLAQEDATFRILYPNNSDVYTSDPANVEYILKTNFDNYGKGHLHHDLLRDLLGEGIFTVDGEKWRHQRKMSSFEFSTRNLKEFSGGVFKRNAAKLARMVAAAVASDEAAEIQDMLMKSALDSVFKVVLGVDLDSMGGTNAAGARFSVAFDRASELTCYRYIDVFWRLKRVLSIGSEAELRRQVKVVDEFVYNVIRSKLERIRESNGSVSGVDKGDILSRFLEMDETDPKYLKDIILSFIIAGKDTTASALSWFFYMMCRHPSYQERIVSEVRRCVRIEANSSIDEIAEGITEEALGEMQFLHAALSETLRLYPAVPQDGKMCFSDDTLPDGFSVKKGYMVTYVPYAMGRMKSLWGEDAEEFRPERWINDNGVFQQESAFKFTAFQAGPRICLGKEFAYRQMKVFAAVLLTAFSFQLNDETKPVKYRTMLTLQIGGGLHLRANPRMSCPEAC